MLRVLNMQTIFYAYFMLGSFSLGYSLLRIGFPKIQEEDLLKKIVYSYLLGLIIFGTGLIAGETLGIEAFIVFSLVMYFFLACAMYIARIATKQTDSAKLIKEKDKINVPQKALSKEEKAAKINAENEEKTKKEEKKEPIKGEIFKVKESNVIAELRRKTAKTEESQKTEEKEKMLKKLREYAKDINKKGEKQKKQEKDLKDELEEELIEQTAEEEY